MRTRVHRVEQARKRTRRGGAVVEGVHLCALLLLMLLLLLLLLPATAILVYQL